MSHRYNTLLYVIVWIALLPSIISCNTRYDCGCCGKIVDIYTPMRNKYSFYSFRVQFEYDSLCYYSTLHCNQILPKGFPVPIKFSSRNPERNQINWGSSIHYGERYDVKYSSRPMQKITIYINNNGAN